MAEQRTLPLAGKRVVITRASEQSQPLAEALRSLGADVTLLPLLRIEAPPDVEPLDAALRKLEDFDWMVLTSQNAIDPIRARAIALGTDLGRICQTVKVAAVSDVTARAAAAAGLTVSYVGRGGTATDLVFELAAELGGKRVLLPRGDRATNAIVEQLKEIGARVTGVIAYRTVEVSIEKENLDAAFRADAILFFSPSTVTAFRKIKRTVLASSTPEPVAIGAIGPVTEAALREAGMHCEFVAPQPSVDQIAAALVRYFEQRPVAETQVSANPRAHLS